MSLVEQILQSPVIRTADEVGYRAPLQLRLNKEAANRLGNETNYPARLFEQFTCLGMRIKLTEDVPEDGFEICL